MKDDATAPETPAQQELEQRLAQLRNQMDDVPEDRRERLKPLWPMFDALRAAMRTEQREQFVRSLVDLARVVITIRREQPQDAYLGRLTVPPYDLWLPFKAASVAPSDRARFASQWPVWNDKIVAHVDGLAEHRARPAADASVLRQGDSGTATDTPATPRR